MIRFHYLYYRIKGLLYGLDPSNFLRLISSSYIFMHVRLRDCPFYLISFFSPKYHLKEPGWASLTRFDGKLDEGVGMPQEDVCGCSEE
jgi:hypothetical protein